MVLIYSFLCTKTNSLVRILIVTYICAGCKSETPNDGAITPNFSMNSVAFDCPGFIVTNDGVAVSTIENIVKESPDTNLYASTSGGGTYSNTLSGVVNGSAESAATVTAIPAAYNADGFFETTTHIGAVSGATDDWYKVWTVPGSIKLN